MSSINLQRVSSGKSINKRVRKISRTDSEVACEEAARLTAELQEDAASPEDEESCEYHDLPPPPDGGYGWVIVFASFMCNMIVDGIAYTFGVFLGEFVSHFNEGKGKVAWVGSLLSGVYLSAGPIVSALANKYGCRTVCIAGSIIACVAFVLSTFSTSVTMLMLTYGVMGGFGFGMIYLPAVVAVGYYFETKRSLATGIAVCGSGFGTFAFAPLATYLLEYMDWKNANFILAGLILNCAVFGALMRPLEYPKKKRMKPLMQRMYEEKRLQLERGSIGGSYFMVQLPDGTMEKRMKLPLNTEPGVHSSLALDQLAAAAQGGLHPVATLPTISESKVADHADAAAEPAKEAAAEVKPKRRPHRVSESDGQPETPTKNMPRNASQPAFSTQAQGIPKNGSVPTFDRIRKTSQGERFKPSLAAIKAGSRGDMGSNNGEVRKNTQLKLSASSVTGSRPNNTDDSDGEMVYTSKSSLRERPAIVRPMSRKDIFYSGSVTNLREFQSQKSLSHYRNSVISLPKYEKASRVDVRDGGEDIERGEKYDLCPCLVLPDSFKSALATMLDVSLLKDPVFMMIGISNVFGMAGLYVPFVYLVDAAVLSGINQSSASFLLSIIGITNTFGRVICGYVADFPRVDSLLLNNMCLVVSTISVALTPFCKSYEAYVAMAIFFGIAVSGYISLTSILLVDLLGLDKLTNAFGLLILFRGAAAIIGSPLAGAVYDATQTYDIPFYIAGFFFLISTITSFMAPLMKRCVKSTEIPAYPEEALTPIDEEPAEDLADDDQPITMVPKIVHTAPSPSTEQPQSVATKPPQNVDKEVNQRESVL
ncbi:monocarboxylate transporter 14 isoform X2 [Phlebotomus argentipes]|uniref:monocarboxylate transporter 14 isoform X2 n=1 Tax=Phlebotomus argentipes TaxID=94469 RepID=UPI00289320AE|nr:monocarboxylate transporter 14 isoform X2 [Phlebotomus argentipes]XP_059607406.1 monocarboxylate transporter 14 isoform X2 [Phlebotomus argentipes]XP_059607407.1 monocarboxylate transporter 14 isoform X2 [Phlebotomus argentipes]XP_059607408.1 monocarboxylate transporter 14 isoform X2 [Phlebotomus argentipes]